MIMSASSLITLEDVQRENPDAWYQAYLPGDPARIEPLVDRVAAAGFDTFVLTADVPCPQPREQHPQRFSDPARHHAAGRIRYRDPPHWPFATWARTLMNHGMPHFENMDAMRGPPVLAKNLMRNISKRDQLAWKHVELIRKRWKGKLVVKGLVAPADADRARERRRRHHRLQSRRPPARPYRLGAAHAAGDRGRGRWHDGDAGQRHPARHRRDQGAGAGAQFVFVGRPLLYAAVASGETGVQHALTLLGNEVDRDMALMGIKASAR